MPAGAYKYFPQYKWPARADAGPDWLLSDSGPVDAIAASKLSTDVGSLEVIEKLNCQASLNRMKLGTDEQESSRRTLAAMGEIAKAIDHIGPADGEDLAAKLANAPDWNEAAKLARRTWYEARVAEGLSRKEVAERLGVTPQALGQALKRHGIL